MSKSDIILTETPDIADMDVAVLEDVLTGEPEALEVTILVPLHQANLFYKLVRELRNNACEEDTGKTTGGENFTRS